MFFFSLISFVPPGFVSHFSWNVICGLICSYPSPLASRKFRLITRKWIEFHLSSSQFGNLCSSVEISWIFFKWLFSPKTFCFCHCFLRKCTELPYGAGPADPCKNPIMGLKMSTKSTNLSQEQNYKRNHAGAIMPNPAGVVCTLVAIPRRYLEVCASCSYGLYMCRT